MRTCCKERKKNRQIVIRFSKKKKRLLKHKNRLKERLYFNKLYKQTSKQQLWQKSFIYPIKNLKHNVKSFGRLRTFIDSGKTYAIRHRGIDFSCSRGTPVVASNHGKIIAAGHYDIRGNSVVIDHGHGVYTSYFHLSEVTTQVGVFIKKGNIIGKVGSTGLSTGNHLHWEMRVHGVGVDPNQWSSAFFNYKNSSLLNNNFNLPQVKYPLFENNAVIRKADIFLRL